MIQIKEMTFHEKIVFMEKTAMLYDYVACLVYMTLYGDKTLTLEQIVTECQKKYLDDLVAHYNKNHGDTWKNISKETYDQILQMHAVSQDELKIAVKHELDKHMHVPVGYVSFVLKGAVVYATSSSIM